MLTLEDNELIKDLRRELIVLLHVTGDQYEQLATADLDEALAGLDEVKAELVARSQEQAALKIGIPPLLPSGRLREVLTPLLAQALGTAPAVSIRLIPELADTLEGARNLLDDWEEPEGVLCFADEAAAGEPMRPLSELRGLLREGIGGDLDRAFPLNHYDILSPWSGASEGVVWGPEAVISRVYGDLALGPVSVTARTVEGVGRLLEQFHI